MYSLNATIAQAADSLQATAIFVGVAVAFMLALYFTGKNTKG